MAKRRLVFETSYDEFEDVGIVGEGGSGRVYRAD